MEAKLTQKFLKELRYLISVNKAIEVIEKLLAFDLEDNRDELIVHMSNLTEINDKRRTDEVDDDYYLKKKNRISAALLKIIDTLIKKREEISNAKFNISLIQDEDSLKHILEEQLGNRYEIENTIHSGDRSVIFKALDLSADEGEKIYKAIKVIKPFSILRNENLSELHPDIMDLVYMSKHEGIISVDSKQIKCYPWYFVMQYVKGKTIGDYIKSNHKWRIDEVLNILIKLLNTVRLCHNDGNIHGNLRPHEIILNEEEDHKPYISPFRLIKNSFYVKRTAERILDNCLYMSPEELSTGQLYRASDQFSIGLIAYEMLEKRPLYEGADALDVVKRRIEHKENPGFVRENISNKEIPDEFIYILDQMLRFEARERFDSLRKPINKISKILNNELTVIEEEALKVRDSYDRCKINPDFFSHFYMNFRNVNANAADKFKLTDFAKQYDKLNNSIEKLLKISILEEAEIKREMSDLANKHATLWDVKKDDYDIFMKELLISIQKFDEKHWNQDLARAWGNFLGTGIRLMKEFS